MEYLFVIFVIACPWLANVFSDLMLKLKLHQMKKYYPPRSAAKEASDKELEDYAEKFL